MPPGDEGVTDRRPDLLDVGRIVKPHGLRGELVVDLWTDQLERLAAGSVLQSDRGDLRILTSRRHQDRFLVVLEGVDDRQGRGPVAGGRAASGAARAR